MGKPYLSIIIPAFNEKETIVRLLGSLVKSEKAPLSEVIIVDDGSIDRLENFVRSWGITRAKKFGDKKKSFLQSVQVLRHTKNRGPAAARNTGVKKATGEVILFLDSDIEVFPDTLAQVKLTFDDPDVHAMTGVWDKEQQTNDFFPKFKALRDWSYWINERDQRGYYYLFSTRIASIRRELFNRLGGFDESYTSASVEDIELTYRIARRYAVIFNPNVRVHHEFEGFEIVARKYFIRSYAWSRLYAKRGKFDPVASTRSEALTAISAFGLMFGGIFIFGYFWILFGLIPLIDSKYYLLLLNIFYILLVLYFASLIVHIRGVRKFLWFVYREEGIVFAIKSFAMGLVLYVIIVAGALTFAWDRVKLKFNRSS